MAKSNDDHDKKKIGQTFNGEVISDAVRKQQEREQRFKSLEGRQEALEAEDDAQERREEIASKHAKQIEQAHKLLKGIDMTKPVPPEIARDLNAQLQKAIDQRKAALDRVPVDLERRLGQIDAREAKDVNLTPKLRLLTYAPAPEQAPDRTAEVDRAAAQPKPQPDRSEEFNRAAEGPKLSVEPAAAFNRAATQREQSRGIDL